MTDQHNLSRFIEAQEAVYDSALSELHAGAKTTHWMWFVFPQITGLGHSSTAQYYALQGAEEAGAFLANPVLGTRLVECTDALVAVEGRSALDIFGSIDELKFRSSMTLFCAVAGPGSVFRRALDKYFDGEPDYRTLELLNQM